MLHTSAVLIGLLCRAGVEAGSPLGSGAAHLAGGVAAPNLSSSDGKGEEPESDGAALWQLLQSKATNHTTQRRRAQNNFGNLAAAGPGGGGPIVGASADGPIPTAVTDGIFVLDLERHTSMQGTGANIGVDMHGNRIPDTRESEFGHAGPTKDRGSGLGIFVNRVALSFDTNYNGSKPDDAAVMAQGNGERSIYSNTTVAEVHYKIQGCPNAVLEPNQDLCDSKFTIYDEFRPFFYGTADVGNANDRGRGDGILYTTWDQPVTEPINLEPGVTTRAPDGEDEVGWFQIESFTMLVDLAQLDQFGSPLVISISPVRCWPSLVPGLNRARMVEHALSCIGASQVSYANVTIIKDVVMPVMDPPQDFFSEALNVTIETPTDDAHIFFTLQPPFVYDKNGTWCPHMGVWCASPSPKFHSRRGCMCAESLVVAICGQVLKFPPRADVPCRSKPAPQLLVLAAWLVHARDGHPLCDALECHGRPGLPGGDEPYPNGRGHDRGPAVRDSAVWRRGGGGGSYGG
jgi:hypothetical protein